MRSHEIGVMTITPHGAVEHDPQADSSSCKLLIKSSFLAFADIDVRFATVLKAKLREHDHV